MLRAVLIALACTATIALFVIAGFIVIVVIDAGTRIRFSEYTHSLYVSLYWMGVWRASCTMRR